MSCRVVMAGTITYKFLSIAVTMRVERVVMLVRVLKFAAIAIAYVLYLVIVWVVTYLICRLVAKLLDKLLNKGTRRYSESSRPRTTMPNSRSWALSVLGCHSYSTPDEIKVAYRKLARENHPDVGGDVERMKDITRAYAILTK